MRLLGPEKKTTQQHRPTRRNSWDNAIGPQLRGCSERIKQNLLLNIHWGLPKPWQKWVNRFLINLHYPLVFQCWAQNIQGTWPLDRWSLGAQVDGGDILTSLGKFPQCHKRQHKGPRAKDSLLGSQLEDVTEGSQVVKKECKMNSMPCDFLEGRVI